MKKIFSIMASVLVAACALSFTGCDEVEDITAPSQKWCEKDFTYDTSTITVHFYYADSDIDISDNTKYSDAFKGALSDEEGNVIIPAGLTLVAESSSSDSIGSVIANDKFVVKTLKAGTSYNSDGDEEESSGKFNMSKTLWKAIYLLNYSSLGGSASTSVPSCIKVNSTKELLEDLGDFEWKKVIAQILINKLLD